MSASSNIHLGNFPIIGSSGSMSALTMSDSGCRIEFIFVMPPGESDNTIIQLPVRYASKTGTTPTYRVALYGVVNGRADIGSGIKSGGNAKATFSPSALGWSTNTLNWLTLGSSYTPAAGEVFAVVIEYDSGTINTSNDASFTTSISAGMSVQGFPFAVTVGVAGVVTFVTNLPISGFKTSSKAFGHPWLTTASTAFNNASAINEKAILFNPPSGWGFSFSISGIRVGISVGASGTFTMRLYDVSNTVLQSVQFDTDNFRNSANGDMIARLLFNDATLAILSSGQTYRIGIAADGGTNISIYVVNFNDATDANSFDGSNIFGYSTRKDSGVWSDDVKVHIPVELLLSDISVQGGSVAGRGILSGGQL